jgi:putative ABC transport system substrate-binding protein
MPTIGVLGTASAAAWSPWTAAFVLRLRELGWIDGRTVAIEYRWANGRNERFAEIAAEFVQLKADVILTSGAAGFAAKQATSTIPILSVILPDPVGSGLVASLARPGGNLTGLSIQLTDLAGKRLELLREVVPGLRRLAFLLDAGYPVMLLEMSEAEAITSTLGIEITKLEIRRPEDLVPAFERLKDGADALYVSGGPLISANRIRINTLANAARLPTMHGEKAYVEAGGLMSYGPNFPVRPFVCNNCDCNRIGGS